MLKKSVITFIEETSLVVATLVVAPKLLLMAIELFVKVLGV